jgi:hypothetical protein
VGFSEGGTSTALYPGDEYAAKVILGWTCTSSDPWFNGIRGPSKSPVLAVVGSEDHYYKNNSNSGHCSVSGRPQSRSIIIKGGPHDITWLPDTSIALEEFLKAVTQP